MNEHQYIHTNDKYDVEFNRLTTQANTLDPITIRHLETIGVDEGWTCLDVGAGSGSIAQWLATRVGSSGHIVATDIDTRFLRHISAPNLEVRQHNILKDGLEKHHYDLVYCRLLLLHLTDPTIGIKHMTDALRPGGWLLIEENDYASMMSADGGDPSATSFATAVKASNDFFWKRGIVHPYFGRQVRSIVEKLGFENVGYDGWTHVNRGGDPMAAVDAASWQAGIRIRVAEGDITQEEADTIHQLFLDPTFYYTSYTLFSAWAKKPS